jgi:hypothetical protein
MIPWNYSRKLKYADAPYFAPSIKLPSARPMSRRGNCKIIEFFNVCRLTAIITLIVRQWFLLGTFLPKELIKWSPNSQLLRNKFRCFSSSTLEHCVKWKPQRWLSLFFLEEIHSKLFFVFERKKIYLGYIKRPKIGRAWWCLLSDWSAAEELWRRRNQFDRGSPDLLLWAAAGTQKMFPRASLFLLRPSLTKWSS